MGVLNTTACLLIQPIYPHYDISIPMLDSGGSSNFVELGGGGGHKLGKKNRVGAPQSWASLNKSVSGVAGGRYCGQSGGRIFLLYFFYFFLFFGKKISKRKRNIFLVWPGDNREGSGMGQGHSVSPPP